jgi:hypothetical protein
MPRQGFEICNHTCGCIQPSRRPHPIEKCTIFQKEGSSGRRHAKSSQKHPNCRAQCPAYGSKGILTREPTSQEWSKWAAHIAQAYSHRHDLLSAIPPLACAPHSERSWPTAPSNPLNSIHKPSSNYINRLPPGLRRKTLPSRGHGSVIYVAAPASCSLRLMMHLPNSVAAVLKEVYPEQVQDAPDVPDHYFIPKSVRKG